MSGFNICVGAIKGGLYARKKKKKKNQGLCLCWCRIGFLCKKGRNPKCFLKIKLKKNINEV